MLVRKEIVIQALHHGSSVSIPNCYSYQDLLTIVQAAKLGGGVVRIEVRLAESHILDLARSGGKHVEFVFFKEEP